MKKFLFALIIILLTLSFVGCGLINFPNLFPKPDVSHPSGGTASGTVNPDDEPLPPINNDDFDSMGYPVIEVSYSEYRVNEDEYYTTLEEVAVYIYVYHKLPSNFKPKSEFSQRDVTSENKLSCGGDKFYNRENLLPYTGRRTYTECDINYHGGGRGAERIVFSSLWEIFYTNDHYESFSIIKVVS